MQLARGRGRLREILCRLSPRASNPASYDLDTARKLWEVTKEMVGVDPDAAIAASEEGGEE